MEEQDVNKSTKTREGVPTGEDKAILIQGQSRYELREFVGKGGMGAVYRAWDHHLNRQVAVKCLLDVDREEAQKLASQEARTLAGLSHPNILRVYDILTGGNQVWIVSEWLDGKCLGEILAANGQIPAPVAVAIMAQVFSALDAAHSNHIFHRDIKPANVMLGLNGQVTIIDFGVAYSPGFSTGETLVGSLRYTDPRLLEGTIPDARSDLFAASLMMLELLTGERVLPDLAPLPLYRHISKNLPSRLVSLSDGIYPPIASLLANLVLPSIAGQSATAGSAGDASRILQDLLRTVTDQPYDKILAEYLSNNTTTVLDASRKMLAHAHEMVSQPALSAREKASWLSYIAVESERSQEGPPFSTPGVASNSDTTFLRSMAKKIPARQTLAAVRRHKWAELWLLVVGVILFVALKNLRNTTPAIPEETRQHFANESDIVIGPLEPQAARGGLTPTVPESGPTEKPVIKTHPITIVANAWADVSIDGLQIGKLPSAKPFQIPAGKHKLRVESPYVEALEIDILVGPNHPDKIPLKLKPKLAPRVITLTKPGQLFVDGISYGVVESKALTLTYGSHEVVIKRGNQVIRPAPLVIGPETPAEIKVEEIP